MKKRLAPTGYRQERLPLRRLDLREFCNASESFLRVVRPWPPNALDTGKEIARGQPIIKVKVVGVHDDGHVEIEGDDLKLTLWYHDPDHLRSALRFGGYTEWKPKYHVLYVISSGSFNLAAPNPTTMTS